jgi:hypothetical protein
MIEREDILLRLKCLKLKIGHIKLRMLNSGKYSKCNIIGLIFFIEIRRNKIKIFEIFYFFNLIFYEK